MGFLSVKFLLKSFITFVDDHEIGVPVLVHLANAAQQESDTSVLDGDIAN